MRRITASIALPLLAFTLSGVPLLAQDHHDDQDHDHHAQGHEQDHHDNHAYVRHDEWRKGEHIRHEDWDRGEKIDYRAHHLNRPPRGYEWREIDGNYVLAAITSGVIASVIAAQNR